MQSEINPPTSETITYPKQPIATDKKIPVVEMFGPTIEGEGKLIGTQTFFIRFGLCDYKCRKCDSMHAVDPNLVRALAKFATQDEIFAALQEHAASKNAIHLKNVTFSGGNPAIHDLTRLVHLLKDNGWTIFVETQGTKRPTWLAEVDEIVCSPKSPGMGEVFEPDVFSAFFTESLNSWRSLSLKIVIFSAQDMEFAANVFAMAADMIKQKLHLHKTDPASVDEGTRRWLSQHCYLSLGNPYPPEFMIEANEATGGLRVVAQDPEIVDYHAGQENNDKLTTRKTLVGDLLSRYNKLSEEMMADPRLSFAKLLPQLHVLVWGNETGR